MITTKPPISKSHTPTRVSSTVVAETGVSSPKEVILDKHACHSLPTDTKEARNRYKDPYIIAREDQNDFIAETLRNGSYIRDPEALVEENNQQFPRLFRAPGDPLLAPAVYYTSRMLASFDGPESTIWGPTGYAVGYRFPGGGELLLGDLSPSVLDHFCFLTLTAAWGLDRYYAEIGIGLDRWCRILAHRWVGLITPSDDGGSWQPGPANRRKTPDGEIVGSVDYVLPHPETAELLLTPHGLLVIHDNVRGWSQMIF